MQCADLSGASLGWGVLMLSLCEDRCGEGQGGRCQLGCCRIQCVEHQCLPGCGSPPIHAERLWERPALV